MSTRANILIKDGHDQLWFYRHSDGYPKGTRPTLDKFMAWLKEGRIRDNVCQAAGWLITLGIEEYRSREANPVQDAGYDPIAAYGGKLFAPGASGGGMEWKVGAYEPTTAQHPDIE